jgi:pantoate--beta-alanine ligase
MKVVTNAQELPSACAFVPTMGALHAGHGSLFALATQYSDDVVASIYVNPLQFEDKEDLARYPRTPERDIELAEKFGVTHLWLPTHEEIYPEGFTYITAGEISQLYEGASRAGHFDGVVTVVRRLFDLVKPRVAIFGEKDFQQLTLIRDIADEVEIIAALFARATEWRCHLVMCALMNLVESQQELFQRRFGILIRRKSFEQSWPLSHSSHWTMPITSMSRPSCHQQISPNLRVR